MAASNHIVVIGSVNMDLVSRVQRLPAAGETVTGEDLLTIPGGKGANQAVAAARLAGPNTHVHFVGRIGDDAFGQQLAAGLATNHVNTQFLFQAPDVPSGTASILVDRRGENSIVISPGANARVTPADVDRARDRIASAAAVVLQLEIPIRTVLHAIQLCRKLNVFSLLDPAPVPQKPLPTSIFRVSQFSPNESEAAALTRKKTAAAQIASALLRRGAQSVVLKLGARGALYVDQTTKPRRAEGFKVRVVDTTAAGDAFTAALAIARAERMDMDQTLRFANAAGALACQTLGAQPSLPTRQAVERFLSSR